MIKRFSLSFLLLAVAISTASTSPRVSRGSLAAMEKSLDARVNGLWADNPFLLIGNTRGVYLDGVGAIFTAEVNLAIGPTSMMHPTATKDEVVKHHQKKLERLPQLKKALIDSMIPMATSLDVPADEQIVMVVFLWRYPWEDTTNIPAQITMQAKKKNLLDAQRAGGAGLEQAIKVVEN